MPGVTVCALPATAPRRGGGPEGSGQRHLGGQVVRRNPLLQREETIRAAVAAVVPARKKDKLAGNLRALELGVQA